MNVRRLQDNKVLLTVDYSSKRYNLVVHYGTLYHVYIFNTRHNIDPYTIIDQVIAPDVSYLLSTCATFLRNEFYEHNSSRDWIKILEVDF